MPEFKDLNERDFKVLNYIKENPGTSKEGVVRGLKGNPSRITILNILEELKGNEMLVERKDKPNSQLIHLYINNENLLVSVSKELDDFEKALISLLEKTKVKFDNEYTIGKSDSKLRPLTRHPINIFYDVISMYIFRMLLKWSVDIQDKEILKKLNSLVFTKITEVQLRMNEILGSTLLRSFNQLRHYFLISRKLYYTENLKNYIDSYSKLGMNKEIEQLIDPLWKINQDLQEIAYPEAWEYGWDFQYQKDDWRRFLELQKQNPDQTHDHYGEERFKKLKSQFRTSRRTEIDTKNK